MTSVNSKGMQTTVSIVLVLMIAIIVMLILSAMMSGSFDTLEQFGISNTNIDLAGGAEE